MYPELGRAEDLSLPGPECYQEGLWWAEHAARSGRDAMAATGPADASPFLREAQAFAAIAHAYFSAAQAAGAVRYETNEDAADAMRDWRKVAG
jgi:hypothetical protein